MLQKIFLRPRGEVNIDMTYRYDNSEVDRWAFGTRSIHAGQPVDATGARNMPIYNTASYVFDSTLR